MHGERDRDGFDDAHLDIEFGLPRPVGEMLFPDIYIGLDIDLLAPGDGIVTDRHHASADRYEADDPQNQIAGQISPFTLSGWLRHGCERVVQAAGATACHPGEANADYMLQGVYDRDLDAGYHEKGTCIGENADDNAGCVIHDLFGGFGDRAGRVIRRPIRFSPIRRQVDVTQGEAEAHYRQLNTQVRSRNAEDEGQPLRQATRDVVGNLVGTWRLTLRELKPEYVGLLVEAVDYLDAHSDDYEMQLGGARNFGGGIADVEVVNPLYTEAELRRVYNRAQDPTSAMDTKDDIWRDQCREEFVRALQARIAAGDGDLPMPTEEESA
ncbi:hypothetical protein [Halobacteriaceae bacterium SHR40]|uniref:hypothetical protein n=1 Tax=Halovenus amylolytica TaxID=2500550 RepID=UPI000FE37A10